jgi:hypothetical protein
MPKVAYCSECKHDVRMTETGCENGHPMSCLRNVRDPGQPGAHAFAVLSTGTASAPGRSVGDSSAKDFHYRPIFPIVDAAAVVALVIAAVTAHAGLPARAFALYTASVFGWRAFWFMRVPYVRITGDEMVIAMAPIRKRIVYRQSVVEATPTWRDLGAEIVLTDRTTAKIRFWYLLPKDEARLRVELGRFAPSAVDASTVPAHAASVSTDAADAATLPAYAATLPADAATASAEATATRRRTFWLQVPVKGATVSALIIAGLTFMDSTRMMGASPVPWSGGLVTARIAMLGAASYSDQGTAGLFAMGAALLFVVLGLFTLNGRRGAAVGALVLFVLDSLGLLYMGSHSLPVTYVAVALHVLLLLGLAMGIWALGALKSEGLPTGNPTLIQAGWFPDPTGRHTQRFWDGVAWTAHVSDDGIAAIDHSGAAL